MTTGAPHQSPEPAYVEGLLADGRGWTVPSGYSVADPYLLVFCLWGGLIGLDMRSL